MKTFKQLLENIFESKIHHEEDEFEHHFETPLDHEHRIHAHVSKHDGSVDWDVEGPSHIVPNHLRKKAAIGGVRLALHAIRTLGRKKYHFVGSTKKHDKIYRAIIQHAHKIGYHGYETSHESPIGTQIPHFHLRRKDA